MIIGLTYNSITSEELLKNIKDNDTEDDWSYYCGDEELKFNVDYFIESNKYFSNKFKEYNITTYDVSYDGDNVLNKIVEDIRNNL